MRTVRIMLPTLAVLLTSGCVTVQPQPMPTLVPAAAHSLSTRPEASQPPAKAALVDTNPGPSTQAKSSKQKRTKPKPEKAAAPAPPPVSRRAEPPPPPPRRALATQRPPAAVPRPVPKRSAAPTAPRPQPSYDMGELCTLADGTTHPSIAALCHSNYSH